MLEAKPEVNKKVLTDTKKLNTLMTSAPYQAFFYVPPGIYGEISTIICKFFLWAPCTHLTSCRHTAHAREPYWPPMLCPCARTLPAADALPEYKRLTVFPRSTANLSYQNTSVLPAKYLPIPGGAPSLAADPCPGTSTLLFSHGTPSLAADACPSACNLQSFVLVQAAYRAADTLP